MTRWLASVAEPVILVIKLGALGDFVQALGPLAAIRGGGGGAASTTMIVPSTSSSSLIQIPSQVGPTRADPSVVWQTAQFAWKTASPAAASPSISSASVAASSASVATSVAAPASSSVLVASSSSSSPPQAASASERTATNVMTIIRERLLMRFRPSSPSGLRIPIRSAPT